MARPRGMATRQLRAIRKSLSTIERALRQLAPLLSKAAASKSSKARRRMKITPKRRAALKLQGQYMGHLRNLQPKQKEAVKAVKEKKGIVAAITAAKKLGRRAA